MAKYICHCHNEACTTFDQAVQYFKEISDTAGPQAVAMWIAQVVEAESKRLVKPTVMDIYGANVSHFNGDGLSLVPIPSDAAVKDWLEFAFTVEEKQ